MKTELTDEQSKPGTDLKFRHFGNSILPCHTGASARCRSRRRRQRILLADLALPDSLSADDKWVLAYRLE